MTLTSPIVAQDFQKGLDAHIIGDFATALQEYTPLAEQGSVAAQYNLAYMYQNGEGVLQDYKEAVKWYRLAAEQGDADAEYTLGQIYYTGFDGVPQNYKEALKWWRLAAKQGANKSHLRLGMMYYLGTGVPQSYHLALMWFYIGDYNGNSHAGELLQKLKKVGILSEEDISYVMAYAAACMNTGYSEEYCGF